jgi:hypothetical protein
MPSSSREGGRLCARDPDRNASRTEERPLSSSEIKKPISERRLLRTYLGVGLFGIRYRSCTTEYSRFIIERHFEWPGVSSPCPELLREADCSRM